MHNDLREGLTYFAYLPAKTVNHLIDGKAQAPMLWSVLAGDEEASDSYDDSLPPLEELLQLFAEE